MLESRFVGVGRNMAYNTFKRSSSPSHSHSQSPLFPQQLVFPNTTSLLKRADPRPLVKAATRRRETMNIRGDILASIITSGAKCVSMQAPKFLGTTRYDPNTEEEDDKLLTEERQQLVPTIPSEQDAAMHEDVAHEAPSPTVTDKMSANSQLFLAHGFKPYEVFGEAQVFESVHWVLG
jgi:hypothetical protein